MNGFDHKNYASALKCYLPDDVKLQKEALVIFCTAINDLNTNFVNAIVRNADKMPEINTKMVQESIKPLLPDRLRKFAFANASRNVVLYHSELNSCEEENTAVEPVTADYRNDVKHILKDFNFSAARGFMPHMNGCLNDICHAIAEKSTRNAHHNNRVLAEDCVLSAVGEILPGDLKHHAVARIRFLQQRSVLPPTSSSKEPESPLAGNQMASDENESLDTEEVEHEGSKSASFQGKARQPFKPVRGKSQTVEKEETPSKVTEVPKFLLAGKKMANGEKESMDIEEVKLEGHTCASFQDNARQLFNSVKGKSQTMEIEETPTKVIEVQKFLLAGKKMANGKESMNTKEVELEAPEHASFYDKALQLFNFVRGKSETMEIEETKIIEEQKFLLARKQMANDEKESMDTEEVELEGPKNASFLGKASQLFNSVKGKSQTIEVEETPTKVIEGPELLLAGKEMMSDKKESMNAEEVELGTSKRASFQGKARQLFNSVKGKGQTVEIEQTPTKVIEGPELLLAGKEMVSDEKESRNAEEVELGSPKRASFQGKARQLFNSVNGKIQTVEIEQTPTKVIEEPELLLAGKEMVSDEKESMNAEEVEFGSSKRASFQGKARQLFNSVKGKSQTMEIEETPTKVIEGPELLLAGKETSSDENESMNAEEVELGSSKRASFQGKARQLFISVTGKGQTVEIEQTPTKVIEGPELLLAGKEMVSDEKESRNVEEVAFESPKRSSFQGKARQLFNSVKGKSQAMEIEETPTKVIREPELLLAGKEMVSDEKESMNAEEIELQSPKRAFQGKALQLFNSVKEKSQTMEIEETPTKVIEQSESPVAKNKMASDAKESMNTKEAADETDKMDSFLDITRRLYYPVGGKRQTMESAENKTVRNYETREEEPKSRTLLGMARQWFSPTDQSPAEETEPTESESSKSDRTVEK